MNIQQPNSALLPGGPEVHASPNFTRALARTKSAPTRFTGEAFSPLTGKDPFGGSNRGDVAAAFEQIVYREQEQQAALSLHSSRTASNGHGDDQSTITDQFAFEFEAEIRISELVRFEERIARAAEGVESQGQRQTLLEAARRVSARFSLSINISGSALNGVASGAEQSNKAGSSALDTFLAFANDALAQVDALFNEVFETLDSFLKGTADFESEFERIFTQLRELFASGGEIDAGSTENFSLQLDFEFEFKSAEFVQVTSGEVKASDPIVLDLDGDGIELTSVRNGAQFDILGHGSRNQTAFVTGGDAFLALDRNGNGVIDSGRELFGDQNGAANGFEELRKLDSNHDGVIDARDESFDQLRVWRDNGNGRTEPGELLTLAQAGVQSISLNYTNRDEVAAGGNRIAQIASFQHSDGRQGRAADVLLNYIV